jgi:hypothetical protein
METYIVQSSLILILRLMINYLKFCKKNNLMPQNASSLRKYKKNLQLSIPIEYSDKEHFIEAYSVNYSLRKSINNERSNNDDY